MGLESKAKEVGMESRSQDLQLRCVQKSHNGPGISWEHGQFAKDAYGTRWETNILL